MTISTETPPSGMLAAPEPRRAGRELVLEWIFEPLSSLLLPILLRLRVPPLAVVLANAATGLLAAVAIGSGELVAGALLLQVKTLLDNCDGRLARASGRVTLTGRYLDTIADLVVNAAIFAALGYATDQPVLAFAGFVALTLLLSVDFNLSELARATAGAASPPPAPSGGLVERALAAGYRALFAPQDRLVRALSDRRLEAVLSRQGTPEEMRRYLDPVTLTVLANMGLTTQLAALGACLVLGVPTLYLWLAVAGILVLVPLQLRRERLVRRQARR